MCGKYRKYINLILTNLYVKTGTMFFLFPTVSFRQNRDTENHKYTSYTIIHKCLGSFITNN